MGCDAYQREVGLSVSEKPALEADDTQSVSLDVFVSSENALSFNNREVDTDEFRTKIRNLSDSNEDCVIVLRIHPNARTGTIIDTLDLISETGCSSQFERFSGDQPKPD